MTSFSRFWPSVVALLMVGSSAVGQDFRVYTVITEAASPSSRSRVVARSLTLFHAGKVYDHVEEAGELVIFEPLHERFLLIKDYTASLVTFEELRQMLEVAHHEAEKHVQRLRLDPSPLAGRAQTQVQFQLQPLFQEHYDQTARRLTLSSPEFGYDVDVIPTETPEITATYLDYADWAARLNAVLHPQAMLPRPRLALNRSLQKHAVLPTRVALRAGGSDSFHLRAEHEFSWQLRSIDKDLIRQWEDLASSEKVQWISIREYQRRLLAKANARR